MEGFFYIMSGLCLVGEKISARLPSYFHQTQTSLAVVK